MKGTKEGTSLRAALRLIGKVFESCGKEGSQCCGISQSQWDVLLALGVKGQLSLVALAQALGQDTSTLSRTVNGMVILGLVERNQSQLDRRYVAIKMTSSGVSLLKHIEAIYDNQLNQLMAHIPKERHDLVQSIILEVAEAAEKMNQDYEKNCCSMRGSYENTKD